MHRFFFFISRLPFLLFLLALCPYLTITTGVGFVPVRIRRRTSAVAAHPRGGGRTLILALSLTLALVMRVGLVVGVGVIVVVVVIRGYRAHGEGDATPVHELQRGTDGDNRGRVRQSIL